MRPSVNLIIEMKENGKWTYFTSSLSDEWQGMFTEMKDESDRDPFSVRNENIIDLVINDSGEMGNACKVGKHANFFDCKSKEEYFETFNINSLPDAALKTRMEVTVNFERSEFYCFDLKSLLDKESSLTHNDDEMSQFFKWLHAINKIANGRETRILFDLG